MDAGHFDMNTAYAAVNRIRCDDMHPYIYKTHDGGKTWFAIVNGLPDEPINTIREDTQTKGLLFAGSETAVYVSFDDGEHWQALQLNMPATSIRDLVIKEDDIVVATHGRSFWILDNITPLRQLAKMTVKNDVVLFRPQTAIRVRWNMNTDTPLPQEEPAGQNPPDGAVIDYYLKKNAKEVVTLDIKDSKGKIVRTFRSDDQPYAIPPVNFPLYWIRLQQILSGEAGSHRFLWDMHYTPLTIPPSYPIAAVYGNTPPTPTSPWVMPGTYTAVLTVNGKAYTQPFMVKMDPRVKISLKDLQAQHDYTVICYESRKKTMDYLDKINVYRKGIKGILEKLNKQLTAFAGTMTGRRDNGNKTVSFSSLIGRFDTLFRVLQEADMPPTEQAVTAVKKAQSDFLILEKKWQAFKKMYHI